MGSLNRAEIIGNLTRDPEVRQTPNGNMVASVGIATNRRWRDRQSGEMKEQTEFHNVVFWGKLAEIVQQYLKKGRQVYVDGRLQTRTWESEDGKKNYKTEIIAENMVMLGNRSDGESSSNYDNQDSPAASAPASKPSSDDSSSSQGGNDEEEIKVEDLPF